MTRTGWLSFLLVMCFLLGKCPGVTAQDSPRFTPLQKAVLFSEAGLFCGSLTGLATLWYDEPRTSFHFFDDSREWLQMDKAGHFTTAYQIVRINNLVLSYAGFDRKTALNISLFSSLLYQLSIEALDGFSPGYGASVADLFSNFAGSGIAWWQIHRGKEDLFSFKYSYRNSGLAQYRPELLGQNAVQRWFKDYNGQTYWITLNLHELSGSSAIPDWINLAAGYSADGMLGGHANPVRDAGGRLLPVMERRRELALSFDIELYKLFKRYKGLSRCLRLFSFLKVPFPGIVWNGKNARFLFE